MYALVWEATPVDLSGLSGVQLSTMLYREEEEKKLKKRSIDKNYRQRLKEKKQEVADGVKELCRKIDELKSEIVCYQQDIDLMVKDLQIKDGESGELRDSIDKSKYEVAKQKEFVSRLCHDPSIQKDVLECSEQLQIELLKNVYAVLDQNCNWEYERKGLEEEIAKLGSDNKMLHVQRQALLERIYKKRKTLGKE